MTAETTGCVVGHSKPTQAHHGYLCAAHFDRLAGMLRDVEEQAALLSAVPSMQQATGSRRAGLASERSPARIDVITMRDRRRGTGIPVHGEPDPVGYDDTASILDVLHSWARTVRDDRLLEQPRHVTISGERDLLTRHLDWLATQPYIDEVFSDVRQLVGQLKAVNGTQDEKPVGRCYLPTDTGVCDGPVWVDDAAGHAHCGRCRQAWDGPQLAMLKHELDEMKRPRTEDGRKMLTPEEIAEQRGVKRGTVFVWAHRMGAVSVRGYYDPEALGNSSKASA